MHAHGCGERSIRPPPDRHQSSAASQGAHGVYNLPEAGAGDHAPKYHQRFLEHVGSGNAHYHYLGSDSAYGGDACLIVTKAAIRHAAVSPV
jgi:hypothetical protein